MQRADRLFAEGHWNEAAAAYRELLRREPHSGDADRWRRRLRSPRMPTSANAAPRPRKRARKAAPAKAAADADSAASQ